MSIDDFLDSTSFFKYGHQTTPCNAIYAARKFHLHYICMPIYSITITHSQRHSILVVFFRGKSLIQWRGHINIGTATTILNLDVLYQFTVLFQPILRIKVSSIENYCFRD